MVQWMAAGQDATKPGPTGEDAVLTVLDPRDYPNQNVLAQAIRRQLADNHAVAITSVTGPEYTWDPESLCLLFGCVPNDYSTDVEWQSAYSSFGVCVIVVTQFYIGALGRLRYFDGGMQNIHLLHNMGKFGTFVEQLENPADTVNLLDFPVEDGWSPDVIRYVKLILRY